jgi:hypothetical protein
MSLPLFWGHGGDEDDLARNGVLAFLFPIPETGLLNDHFPSVSQLAKWSRSRDRGRKVRLQSESR